jgi:hypothetical protein
MPIRNAIKTLLETVSILHNSYPKKEFTLDGRLVGDLGEVLVEESYDIKLFDGLSKHHDGQTSDGRMVQIKATMKDTLTFPVDHIPDYYLGIKINSDGTFTEIYNGPGKIAAEAIKNRRPTKTNLHSVTLSALKKLNEKVPSAEKIKRKG